MLGLPGRNPRRNNRELCTLKAQKSRETGWWRAFIIHFALSAACDVRFGLSRPFQFLCVG
jgi:hypothetical protein